MRTFRVSRPGREALAFVPVVSAVDGGVNALEIIDLREHSPLYGRVVRNVPLPPLRDPFGRYAVASRWQARDSHILVSGHLLRIWAVPSAGGSGGPSPEERIIGSGPAHAADIDAEVALLDEASLELTSFMTVTQENHFASFDIWCCPHHGLLVRSEPCQTGLLTYGIDWASLKRGEYGHRLDFFNLWDGSFHQTLDLGPENQMVLSLAGVRQHRGECYGYASVLACLPGLGSAVWCWHKTRGHWKARKVIEIPPEPCSPALLPESLAAFGLVPPLITDIRLSPNDRFLYVACWGTGELLQYDVSQPLRPRLTGTVRLGGIAQRLPHPSELDIEGGPYSLEISDDGLRIYVTNSASAVLDGQFYPGKTQGWMVKFDSLPHGGITIDEQFFVRFHHGAPQEILLRGGLAALQSGLL
jgi:selenium-binding protein 1